jgi:hypothetical protein
LGKTTLARAIKRGALSAGRKDDGGYLIEVSELERVYPVKPPDETGNATAPVVHHAIVDIDLAKEVAALQATLAIMREQMDEVRADRDRWHAQAERLALTHQKPPQATPKPAPKHPWLQFWGFRRTG